MLGQWQCDDGHRHTSASRETECWGHFLLHHWFSCKYLGNCTLVKQSPFYLLQGYALELKYYAHMLMLVPWHPIYLNVVVVFAHWREYLSEYLMGKGRFWFLNVPKMPCIRFREWNPNNQNFEKVQGPEPPLLNCLKVNMWWRMFFSPRSAL